MSAAVKKSDVLEIATLQSQRAQHVTRALRAHGWRTHYARGMMTPIVSDDDYRREEAQEALDWARLVERDASATRSWVERWAREQGAS